MNIGEFSSFTKRNWLASQKIILRTNRFSLVAFTCDGANKRGRNGARQKNPRARPGDDAHHRDGAAKDRQRPQTGLRR